MRASIIGYSKALSTPLHSGCRLPAGAAGFPGYRQENTVTHPMSAAGGHAEEGALLGRLRWLFLVGFRWVKSPNALRDHGSGNILANAYGYIFWHR